MQLSMGKIVASPVDDAWEPIGELFRFAVHEVTPKEVCYRLDIAPSYLSDAMTGNTRKDVRARWLRPVVEMASEGARLAFLAAFCGPQYEVTRRAPLELDVELERTRQLIAKYAPGVLMLVDKELGR